MNRLDIRQLVKEIFGTIVGAFLLSVGVGLFLLPNQLSSGGFSGIATILFYLADISVGTTIMVINIPVFLIAVFKIGKTYVLKAILGTVFFSIFVDFVNRFEPLTDDRFLACIYGGIIIGLATAIILNCNSSTGGSDLIGRIVRKIKPKFRISQIIIMFDIFVVLLNTIAFREIEIGLYSAIAIFISGRIIDIVFEGVNFTKLLVIISDKTDKISEQIALEIERGVTGLYGKGMYTGEDKLVLICAAARGDVARVKQIAKQIDPTSFIVITNSREVVGKGFKKE